MKNKYVLFLALLFNLLTASNAQEITPEMEAFIKRMDSASLEELEQELEAGLEGLRAFAGFFEGPDEEIKNIPKTEETLGEPFKIDTSAATKALRQFDNIGFEQLFKDNTSFVEFNKIGNDYWSRVWMEEGMEETLVPKTIYYKDGTTLSEGVASYKTSFFWPEEWGKVAIIDSIAMEYNINYTAQYDSLLLNKKSKKIKYKDGVIKVEKLENNYLYFTVSDAFANGIYVRALNSEGQPLSFSSSSFSPTSDAKSSEGFTEMVELLEEILTKLKAKKFADTESLKDYLIKKVGKMEIAKDDDGVSHKKFYYKGNIESVLVYIETEGKSETVSFTAKNTSGFGDIILMQSKTETTFLDADAKKLFSTDYLPIKSLGSRYFINDSLYYHLNLKNQKLEELPAVNVFEAMNGLAFIQPDSDANFKTYNADYELISDIPLIQIETIDNNYVLGTDTEKGYHVLNKKGEIKTLEGIQEIGQLSEGLMFAKSNGLYGFLNTAGEVVVPFQYEDANNFREGLAAVTNTDGLYGYINHNGKEVLPFQYERAQDFENGIALVYYEDSILLIDKKGNTIVKAPSRGYSINGSGVKKTYYLSGKTYDAFGQLIPEETK